MLAPLGFVAAWAGPPTLAVEPAQITLGEAHSVGLRIRGAAAGDLRVDVESGSSGELVPDADGSLRIEWRLPSDLTPRRLAACVVNLRTGEVAFATVAVSRRARFRIKAHPGAEVRLVTSATDVATGVADPAGRMELTVLVRPGTDVARLEQHVARLEEQVQQAHNGGERVEELGFKDRLRLWTVPRHDAVLPDGQTPLPVYIYVYRDAAAEPETAQVSLRLPGGERFAAQPLGAGSFRADVVVPLSLAGDALETIPVVAEAWIGEERVSAEIALLVQALPPARVEIEAAPPAWAAGEVNDVIARVTDVTARGVSGLHVEPVVNGVALSSAQNGVATDLGGGRYRVAVRAPEQLPESGRLRVGVRVPHGGPASLERDVPMRPGPPARVSLTALDSAHDGAVPVAVQLEDRYGNSIPIGELRVRTERGSLLPARAQKAGAGEALWRPAEPRRSSDVAVSATVSGGAEDVQDELVLRYVAPREPVAVSAYAGVAASDLGSIAPTVAALLAFTRADLSEDWSLVVDAAAARVTDSVGSQGFVLPVIAGAQCRWLPAPRWALRTGAGSGMVAGSPGTMDAVGWTVGWLVQGWATLGLEVGPGEVEVHVRARQTLVTPGAGGSAVAVLVGYRIGFAP